MKFSSKTAVISPLSVPKDLKTPIDIFFYICSILKSGNVKLVFEN